MLFISVRTAETHRAHIMQKLGLGSRAELVRYALAEGLLEWSPEPSGQELTDDEHVARGPTRTRGSTVRSPVGRRRGGRRQLLCLVDQFLGRFALRLVVARLDVPALRRRACDRSSAAATSPS